MLSIVSVFLSFRIGNSYGKVPFDIVIKSNLVHQYAIDMESKVF